MRVQIAETGATETLELTIGDSPSNWAVDTILPYCPGLPYDDETCTYTMTAEEYAYWVDTLARYEAIEEAKADNPDIEEALQAIDWNDLNTALDQAERLIEEAREADGEDND